MGLFQKVLIITAALALVACDRDLSDRDVRRIAEASARSEDNDHSGDSSPEPEDHNEEAEESGDEPEEIATLQEEDVRFPVESDFPLCAEYAFESVEMTPTMRTEARGKAAQQACAPGARLPIQDGILDLSDGRRIHFNARALQQRS